MEYADYLNMRKKDQSLEVGRMAFGGNPTGYHHGRASYPDWVYEILRVKCNLKQNTHVFEIGPGSGIATRRLLDYGANPLLAIEPDVRFADFLKKDISHPALQVMCSTFESAGLLSSAFDLGISATAFHWLNEQDALGKIATALRPKGWWAMFWNVYGDPARTDSFHEATKSLLGPPIGQNQHNQDLPFSLDKDARIKAIHRSKAFDNIEFYSKPWTLSLNTAQTVALYSTFSNITSRPDREKVLAKLGKIADEEFNGTVTRNMITTLYVTRRVP